MKSLIKLSSVVFYNNVAIEGKNLGNQVANYIEQYKW